MKIISVRALRGPNIYHKFPVLITRLDLGVFADTSSQDLPHFVKTLMADFPRLIEHTCSLGRRGGFLERLERGTYFAHIIEHVALEISAMVGIGVTYGKSIYGGEKGIYNVITRYLDEQAMIECHRVAFSYIQRVVTVGRADKKGEIEAIKKLVEEHKLGPSGQALFDAAKKMKIPVERTYTGSQLRLGHGIHTRYVQTAVTDKTSHLAVQLAQDKYRTKIVLKSVGVPVPRGLMVRSVEEALEATTELSFPLAIKPLDGNHGNGVTLNIDSQQGLHRAFEHAQKFCRVVLIEEMCVGKDYRVLVVGGKVCAAAERLAPSVLGDGRSTVNELIKQLNSDPLRGVGHSSVLTRIIVDESVLASLKRQNLALESVVEKNAKIFLRENANISGGGNAKDVTDLLHPTVRLTCELTARTIGLDICGVDIIHSDISAPVSEGFKIIEVNAGPGLRMHLAPSEGQPRPVAEDIIKMLYPAGQQSTIPIISVTGTNGKTSTVRMLEKMFSTAGYVTGMTSTDGIWIGGEKTGTGDCSGPVSASRVLSDSKVEIAILESARGGILRRGLGYSYSDVGVVTNVHEDHIGQDGIRGIKDLVQIKALVVDHTKKNGTIVLNADSKESLNLFDRAADSRMERRVYIYGTTPEAVERAVTSRAPDAKCWVEKGEIFFASAATNATSTTSAASSSEIRLGRVSELSVTSYGTISFQISNCLAALCAAHGVGMDITSAFDALRWFNPSSQNSGRMNIFDLKNACIVLDYGHNAHAMSAIATALEQYEFTLRRLIIALPGDRDPEISKDALRAIVPSFDEIIIREDIALRGRPYGEMSKFLADVVRSEFPDKRVVVIMDELQAMDACIKKLQPGELLVAFYDRIIEIEKMLSQAGAQSRSTLPKEKLKWALALCESVLRAT